MPSIELDVPTRQNGVDFDRGGGTLRKNINNVTYLYDKPKKQGDVMSKALFLVCLMFLSGCASVPVDKTRNIKAPADQTMNSKVPKDLASDPNVSIDQTSNSFESLQHQYRQCFKSLRNDQELRSIANKVTLESFYEKDIHFELQRIVEVPTQEEKNVIRKWATKLESCYKIKAESYAYALPDVASLSALEDSEQQLLVAELYKGSLTYGQFAAKHRGIDSKYRGLILQAEVIDQKSKQNRKLELQQHQQK